MPVYEYQCQKCRHHLEKLQKVSDSALRACPQCGEEELIKLISAAGFQLKGSGWYATDFKNKAKEKSETTTESVAKPATEVQTKSTSTSDPV